MEEPKADVISAELSAAKDLKLEQLTTNWRLTQDNKRLCDCVSLIHTSKAPKRLTLEDIVTDACIILQPINANVDNQREACMVDINLMAGQRISRIGVVSEGSVLEFFKESGEYAGTSIAEFFESYEDATVYYSEFTFDRPTAQASIKFTRIDNSRPDMYLYGIKLVVDDAKTSSNDRSIFEGFLKSSYGNNKQRPMGLPDFTNIPDDDADFVTEIQACIRSFAGQGLAPRLEKPQTKTKIAEVNAIEEKDNYRAETEAPKKSNIELYIDDKLREMEQRLLRRIDEAEAKTNDKLDAILRHLESRNSAS